MANAPRSATSVLPYTLEFVRFVAGFVLVVGLALALLRIISVTAADSPLYATPQNATGSVQGGV
ncbi:MAG TPA: hypothetical protein VF829_01065 [Candidatus Paceibacterota bacterium]